MISLTVVICCRVDNLDCYRRIFNERNHIIYFWMDIFELFNLTLDLCFIIVDTKFGHETSESRSYYDSLPVRIYEVDRIPSAVCVG